MATLSSKMLPAGVATLAQGALADTSVQPNDSPAFDGLTVNGNAYPSDGALSNRNIIINPFMAVAQRDNRAPAAYTVPFYAGPDRWLVARSGTGTTGFSRIANTDFGGTYAAQATFESAATESWNVQQRIESANVAHLAGQEVTLSFYVSGSSSAGSSTMFAALNYANVIDNFSADTEIANFSVAYTGTATKFTFTFTLPAQATNGVSVVLRGVKTDATGTFTLTFGGVQLETGNTATPFEHRSIGTELAFCQRYYVKQTREILMSARALSPPNSGAGVVLFWPTQMRAAPGVVETGSAALSSLSVGGITVGGCWFAAAATSAVTTAALSGYTADAEL